MTEFIEVHYVILSIVPGGKAGVSGDILLHNPVQTHWQTADGTRPQQLHTLSSSGPICHAPWHDHLHHAGNIHRVWRASYNSKSFHPWLNAWFFLLEHQGAFEPSVIVAYESLSCPTVNRFSLSTKNNTLMLLLCSLLIWICVFPLRLCFPLFSTSPLFLCTKVSSWWGK